jgi:hypothetical protein
MWVGRIKRCLRRSSMCECWVSGLGGGVVSWGFVCLCGFLVFWVGCCWVWLVLAGLWVFGLFVWWFCSFKFGGLLEVCLI